MQPIISVQNLGKRYLIGHQSAQSERYVALRDVIARGVKDVARKTMEAFRGQQILQGDEVEEFWALRDVSFEVGQGEVVGIIGRNGAGKSTLLKVLSRITEPSAGRVTMGGRVASLLEVGTGFHPELTGRENIFLNGAILGMTKQEIRNKFDEIVDFAGVEKFLDTPVKRYSSGMYVRLAFAVAAHLEPEILIVDEVLAVGDASFQKKCLGKMQEVSGKDGRTVLFVSHNMTAVANLCGRIVWLQQGAIKTIGDANSVIAEYLEAQEVQGHQGKLLSDVAELSVSIADDEGERLTACYSGKAVTFVVDVTPQRTLHNASVGIGIVSPYGQRVATLHTEYQLKGRLDIRQPTRFLARWNKNILCSGPYEIVLALFADGQMVSAWDNAARLNVLEADVYGTGKLPNPSYQGPILTDVSWSVDSHRA